MKTRLVPILGLVAAIALLTSILPATSPGAVKAEPGALRWARVDTPGSISSKCDIASPSEVNRIAIGTDGRTFYAVDIASADNGTGGNALYMSADGGISWSDRTGRYLYQAMSPVERVNFRIWNVAIAPDDASFVAVITNDHTSHLPRNVWASTNGGATWQNTACPAASNISAIDISTGYGGRDIAIGTRTGTGSGALWVLRATSYGRWSAQGLSGDIIALKFSPSYTGDATVAVVYSSASGTYLNAGVRDMAANLTNWESIYGAAPPEVTAGGIGTSPKANQIVSADLELPSDFQGQASGLRRYYVSLDDAGATGNAGIYRFDDTAGYWLARATATRRFASIAYYGVCTSGKLLAGEVLGNPCSATVMTWFTDAPVTCPDTCWYHSLKPPTGAAGTGNCTGSGYGNAQVAWSPDGLIAYAGTASSAALVAGPGWPGPYLSGQSLDESALSASQNNGRTWNQLALIDTRISHLADIAPAPDCSTLYLASINDQPGCSGFDSVWRSQGSPTGLLWERVLCIPSTDQPCAAGQTDMAILGLPGDRADGQVVFWAAIGSRKVLWSPDSGDYWIDIVPRLEVQDMAAEDSKTLYVLSASGIIQKFTYSGAGWLCGPNISTGIEAAYSIATAYTGVTPDNDLGHIIVGGTGTAAYDVAYSMDGGMSFTPVLRQLPTRYNTMVVASSSYNSDGSIIAINSGGMYVWQIYAGQGDWETWWGGPSWPSPVTGLAISRNYGFYFSTPSSPWSPATPYIRWSAATAGLDPGVSLGTGTPTRRLRICGGLEAGEPINVWALDQRPYSPPQGGVWCYSDTVSWLGPTPTTPISRAAVDCDPVSGRAGQIDITWQPRSLSKGYRIQIAKDEDFAIQIADIGSAWGGPFYTPHDLDAPSLAIPPGGGAVTDGNGNSWTVPALEAGHIYYWKVRVQDVATGDAITSPWSWRESFIVKAGLRAGSAYPGLRSLSPRNGGTGCPVRPVAFSWSPFKDATGYRFVLARDAEMTDIVAEAETTTTAYEYQGQLEYSNNYFWQVRAAGPAPGDWSATFCFRTEAAPAQTPLPEQQASTAWVWALIAIGVLLDVGLLILILRRVSIRTGPD